MLLVQEHVQELWKVELLAFLKKAVNKVQFLNNMNELFFHISPYLSVHVPLLCFRVALLAVCSVYQRIFCAAMKLSILPSTTLIPLAEYLQKHLV